MAFRALLRQEIAYFDIPQHSTGVLIARLTLDASGVQGVSSSILWSVEYAVSIYDVLKQGNQSDS